MIFPAEVMAMKPLFDILAEGGMLEVI